MKALIAGLSAAALVLTACSAVANGQSTHVRGDMLIGQDPAFEMVDFFALADGDLARHGNQARGDLLSYTVRHGPRNITAHLRVREIVRERGAGYGGLIAFETSSGDYQAGTWHSVSESGRGREALDLTHEQPWKPAVRCPGFEGGVDYATDTFWLSIPRSCLDRPRWIRVYPVTHYAIPRDRYDVTDFAPDLRQFSVRLYAK